MDACTLSYLTAWGYLGKHNLLWGTVSVPLAWIFLMANWCGRVSLTRYHYTIPGRVGCVGKPSWGEPGSLGASQWAVLHSSSLCSKVPVMITSQSWVCREDTTYLGHVIWGIKAELNWSLWSQQQGNTHTAVWIARMRWKQKRNWGQ